MSEFRRFYIIQCRSTGSFLTEELGYTNLAEKAGRLYCPHEAVDTAQLNLDDDYAVFSAWEEILEPVEMESH
ncbi:hypothetical protein LG201_13050 [Methylobacillus gramineus]|uniref:hypothetical protein n=1 Tax=Methylobacillus gramineus TaxID=755169 RepID=UPI001CFF77B5|nr:hypothetical protein [Methylobacillus gramineus]MCB5186135.1 hypothetical protein [Methylobacillus gramineus]